MREAGNECKESGNKKADPLLNETADNAIRRVLAIGVVMKQDKEKSGQKENQSQEKNRFLLFSDETQGHFSFTVTEERRVGERQLRT